METNPEENLLTAYSYPALNKCIFYRMLENKKTKKFQENLDNPV